MKRLGRSKSEREMYASNWQNMEANISVSFKPTEVDAPTVAQPSHDDQTQSSEGIKRRGFLSHRHQSMYKATLEGDYVAVEMLLEEDSNLASDEINEEGDRALHVAAATKHQKLVRKLVERMSPSELALLDGRGYTACCYAAISGSVEIAHFMMRKNPSLATARDKENNTPLQKAASRGNAYMVSYFLEYAKAEDLSTQEWFDLLLVTIRRNMYGVGLQILRINEQLATMSNDQGTALHLLAGQHLHKNAMKSRSGRMKRDMRLLAEKLWECIQRLSQCSPVELMKKPPILHNAAVVGNVELITILTHTYPELIWLTDGEGYTIFHIAVKYRQESLFKLINEIEAMKDLIAVWQDKDGNNMLHLAGEPGAPSTQMWRKPDFEMQREILWFEKVEKIVPPLCLEMKNKAMETAHELFEKRHVRLLEESGKRMRNASDSFLLISTLILTMVIGASFAVPGGYNQESGIPVMLGTGNWFTCFIIFQTVAMLSSTFSILCFLKIMGSPMKEEDFKSYLPNLFRLGVNSLRVSVLAVVSVLVSSFFLIYAEHSAAFAPLLIKCIIIVVYVVFVLATCCFISISCQLPNHGLWKRSRHILFNRDCKRKCWVF